MNETNIIFFKLNSIKVLINKNNKRDYKGARIKRTTIIIIEYISIVDRYLNSIII
jgi:hypothetical protein